MDTHPAAPVTHPRCMMLYARLVIATVAEAVGARAATIDAFSESPKHSGQSLLPRVFYSICPN